MESKAVQYRELVADRQACQRCHSIGLTNPASVQRGEFDGEEVGPWTRWNGDLNARIVVIGQEWGDVASFERQRGLDTPSPTNRMLRELLASVGVAIAEAPRRSSSGGVFLTNAALCLKIGGAQAEVKAQWFDNCAQAFLRTQVELVRPKVVVTLGQRAYVAMRQAFALPKTSFRRAANLGQSIPLPFGGSLVPVYHCGQRILNTHRPPAAQFKDSQLVGRMLNMGDA